MKVALCHPTYWPEVRRGAERLTHDAAVALAARGHAVRIVTSHQAAKQQATEDGVEVLRLRRPPGDRLERRRFEPHVQLAPFTYAALKAGDDDFVFGLQAADAAAAARSGRPCAYWNMGVPHRAWLTARRGRVTLVQRAVEGCGAVLALSEFARDGFWKWLGVEAQVVPPPVDTVRFSPGGVTCADPTIVCAADAGEPRKRVELLVAAMPAVRREHPTARLVLDARTAGAFAGVEGVELADMTDLPALYREAWVSALPSWGEAFGLVLAEALACGTPVVGANREGIPEVVGEADGRRRALRRRGRRPGAARGARPRPRSRHGRPLPGPGETFAADRCAERLESVASTLL